MAIAHDAETRFPATDGASSNSVDTTTGDRTFSHNPVGTPAGVVVVICSDATTAPVTGVLYAGTAMTLVQTAVDTSEAGRVDIYVLANQAIPTNDPATVTLQGCTSANKWVTCSTVTSATGQTENVGSNFKDTTTATNPTLTVVTSKACLVYGALHGGAASPGSYVAGSAYTAQFNNDYGQKSARSQRRTSVSSGGGNEIFSFQYATSDDYCIAAVALAEKILPTSTPVARVSLGSYGEPSTRTAHSIKVRARTTSGSTGVLKAALYEGANNRSGDLTSSALTTSLADYTLSIPDASAANITSYSDLEIRFWGYDANGGSLVFEVADLYLEVPASAGPQTFYGATALPITLSRVVSGSRQTFSQIVAPFTFTKAVSGIKIAFGQIASPFTFTKAVSGVRTALGQILASFTFVKSVSATRQTFAQLVRPFAFVKDVAGRRTTFGQIASPFIFTKVVSGVKLAFGQIAAPFTFVKSVSATRQTLGQVVRPFTLVKDISAVRTTFGQTLTSIVATIATAGNKTTVTLYGVVSAPFTFVKSVSGQRTALGQTVSTFTFTSVVSGTRNTFAAIIAPFTFVKDVVARKTTFGQIVVPLTFTKSVSGIKIALGQIVRPFTFVKDVVARKTTFGQVVRPFTFTKAVSGVRSALGQIVAPFTFNRVISGRRTTFSRVDLPLIFVDQTDARKQTFGQIVFPINIELEAVAEVQGIRYGQATMSLVFGKDVEAFKQTFGQFSAPYLFDRSTQARRTTFSSLVRPFTFVKDVAGRRTTFGQSSLPITASFVVAGRRLSYGQVALSLVLGEQIAGQRKAFGATTSSYNFNRELTGRKETFSLLDFPIDFVVDVNTGRVEAFSSLGREFLIGIEIAGIVRPTGVILNLAKAIYLGSTEVEAVYVDSQEVWSK